MCLTAAFWALSVFLATVIDAQQAAVDSVPTFKPPQSRPTFKDAGNGSTAKRELEVERTVSYFGSFRCLISLFPEIAQNRRPDPDKERSGVEGNRLHALGGRDSDRHRRNPEGAPAGRFQLYLRSTLRRVQRTARRRLRRGTHSGASRRRDHRTHVLHAGHQRGHHRRVLQIPVYFWGLVTAHQLSDFNRFPTSTSMSADSSQLANAFVEFMGQYDFDRFAFLYTQSATEKCKYIGDDLKAVIENTSNSDITMTYSRKIENGTADNIQRVLKAAVLKARIFAICFDSDTDRRRFFLQVYDMKLDTEDYLYVMLDTRAYGFGQRLIRNITDSELKAVSEKKNFGGFIKRKWRNSSVLHRPERDSGRPDNDAMKAARRLSR
ncbi:hypothetical protein L596_023604 [Steinernema carpocapsae]|uniref:Receptor ligand binding region domain-containing protein n=1 Tax=Steinernema carpocapsae TaxID=34508 RepID=A0A4U5ME75_STECR|nr:hypothetical protein L596_023604 [Steinernema carpocapsae]